MNCLLDTQLLLWAAAQPERLSARAVEILADPGNELTFSAASVWEVVIKAGLGRPDFQVDASALAEALLGAGYLELPVRGAHAAAVAALPYLHRDPFDPLLVAQAVVERLTLVTADRRLAGYPGRPVLV